MKSCISSFLSWIFAAVFNISNLLAVVHLLLGSLDHHLLGMRGGGEALVLKFVVTSGGVVTSASIQVVQSFVELFQV